MDSGASESLALRLGVGADARQLLAKEAATALLDVRAAATGERWAASVSSRAEHKLST